ncbi:MAG: PH domain-containing protein [Rhodococcus sp. (in: high G+C Gram-positive bacteria)]
MRRQSGRLLAIRGLEVARSSWIVLAPLIVVIGTSTGWLRVGCLALLCYYLYSRGARVLVDWLSVRYRASARGVEVRSGLLSVEVRVIRWDAVTAVELGDEVAQRLAKCRKVTLSTIGPFGSVVVLPCVRESEAMRIRRLYSHRSSAGRVGTTQRTAAAPGVVTEPLSTPLGVKDHIVLGLSSGRALLVVPFTLGAVQRVGALIGVSADPLRFVIGAVHVDDAAVIPMVLGLALAAALYGAVLSWVRYRGYRVSREEHALNFSAGLFRREARTVQVQDVAAIVCRPGLVLASFGKTRVRCLTAGDAAGLTGGMVLPIADLDRARAADRLFIGASFPERTGATWARACVGAIVGATVLAVLGLRSEPRAFVVAAGLIIGLAIVGFAGEFRGRIRLHGSADERWVITDRMALPGSQWAARCSVIDRVSWHRLGSGRRSICWVTLSFRASRSRRIRVQERGARTFAEIRYTLSPQDHSDVRQEGGQRWQLLR